MEPLRTAMGISCFLDEIIQDDYSLVLSYMIYKFSKIANEKFSSCLYCFKELLYCYLARCPVDGASQTGPDSHYLVYRWASLLPQCCILRGQGCSKYLIGVSVSYTLCKFLTLPCAV